MCKEKNVSLTSDLKHEHDIDVQRNILTTIIMMSRMPNIIHNAISHGKRHSVHSKSD